MARESIIDPNIHKLPPIFDDGGYYNDLLKGRLPADSFEVFLSSTSRLRGQGLRRTLDQFGYEGVIRQYNGHNGDEHGDTPVHQAVNKGIDAANQMLVKGYWERHPGKIALIYTGDSVDQVFDKNGNIVIANLNHGRLPDKYRGKPHGDEDFLFHGMEWERAAMGEYKFMVSAGYALVAMLGPQPIVFTLEDNTYMTPRSREFIQKVFVLPRIEEAEGHAHSLGSLEAILDGNVVLEELSGTIIPGQSAIDAVYGSSTDHFSALTEAFVQTISPYLERTEAELPLHF